MCFMGAGRDVARAVTQSVAYRLVFLSPPCGILVRRADTDEQHEHIYRDENEAATVLNVGYDS